MKWLLLLILITLLIGCSQFEQFENHMRSGKDYFIEGNYNEAIKSFDVALIEKPTDADAKILMDKAKQKYAGQLLDENKNEYISDIEPILEKYSPILDKYGEYDCKEEELLSTEDIEAIKEIEDLIIKSNIVSDKYKNVELLQLVHENLVNSMEYLIENMSHKNIGILGKSFDTNSYKEYINFLDIIRDK